VQWRAALRPELLGAQPVDTIASPAIVMQSYVPMAALLPGGSWANASTGARGAAIALSFAGVLVLASTRACSNARRRWLLMLVSALFQAIGTVLMRGPAGHEPFQPAGMDGGHRCLAH
jgi:O-acetylserine/cysteine efflux transporter